MPRAPAKIRRRYIEGETEVLDWRLEETLLYGTDQIIGPPCMLSTLNEWRHEWQRWRDVILPKCIEHRPGTRPFAMYVLGELPQRELRLPLPPGSGFWSVTVTHPGGRQVKHWVNVTWPFMESQATHLHRAGIIDDDELDRHREWMAERNDQCSTCAVDTYPLEMSLFDSPEAAA